MLLYVPEQLTRVNERELLLELDFCNCKLQVELCHTRLKKVKTYILLLTRNNINQVEPGRGA